MLDISHWVVRDLKVEEVVAVARRGPAEVKFDKAEMEYVAANLDVPALDAELERVRARMQAVGQDVAQSRTYILAALPGAEPAVSTTRFRLEFLGSPHRIVGDDQGRVAGLEVEDTTLVAAEGDTKARGLGTFRVIPADTVVFAIGDRVDETVGLPVRANSFVKNTQPSFPVAGLSYEAFDPAANQAVPGLFMAGWAREASTGLVGAARKDGTNGAQAVLGYLAQLPPLAGADVDGLHQKLRQLCKPAVSKDDWARLESVEHAEAARRGLPEFKYGTNAEMLAAMGLATVP
jgi:ferredoxin--NADP+ reductase